MSNLSVLEQELANSGNYDGRKDDAASIVKTHYLNQKNPPATDEATNDHFLTKHFRYLDIDIPQNQPESRYTPHQLETAFFEFIQAALFARYKNDSQQAQTYFDKAKQVAGHLNDAFLTNYHSIMSGLTGTDLLNKLKTDVCYESINRTLEQDVTKGMNLIGTGFSLVDANTDTRRDLDFYLKSQYALYETESDGFPHSALSLGKYLLEQTTNVGYTTLTSWTHFHCGNIYLDLNDATSAKSEFEKALAIANRAGFQYAIMTLKERLGLTEKRLGNYPNAEQWYDNSLQVDLDEEMASLAQKNKVRCLAGLGLLDYERAKQSSGSDREQLLAAAENQLLKALAIARSEKYRANEATILSSLGDLYRERYGNSHEDAKRFHKMAFEMKTNELKLSETQARVAHDKQYMNQRTP